MSGHDDDQTTSENSDDEQTASENSGEEQTTSDESRDDGSTSEVPELSEEGKEEVKRMRAAYDDRPTAVMPGTDGTITGTAINEWLDDDGNPKFGKDEAENKDKSQGSDEEAEGTDKAQDEASDKSDKSDTSDKSQDESAHA